MNKTQKTKTQKTKTQKTKTQKTKTKPKTKTKTKTKKTRILTPPTPITMTLINQYLENKNIRHLLMNGTKNSNQHTINQENASKWVRAQTSPNRKFAAESIINTVTYISYRHFIETTNIVIDKFIKTVGNSPFVIITETTKKSGFFCTLLFCYLLQKKKYSTFENLLDISTSFNKLYKNHTTEVKYILINDMDYSGNQSINYYKSLIRSIPKKPTPNPIQFINIRSFQSTFAFRRFQNFDGKNIIKITNIVGKLIPTLFEKLQEIYPTDYLQRYKEISRYWCLCPWPGYSQQTPKQTPKQPTWQDFFGKTEENPSNQYPFNYGPDCPKTNVYFDHKIADPTSTLILPLVSGFVPIDDDYKVPHSWCGENHLKPDCNEEIGPCIKPTQNGNRAPHKRFYALINKCKYGEHIQAFVKKYKYNIFDLTNELMAYITDIRCPDSWYKKINWDTGEITSHSKREIY